MRTTGGGSGPSSSTANTFSTRPVVELDGIIDASMGSFLNASTPDSPQSSQQAVPSNSVCRHMLPSCRTVRENAQLIREAFSDLSMLGKAQVTVLLVNLIATFVIVYGVSSEEHRRADYVSLYFGLEFIVLTVVNIIYTVCVENIFAFYALIFLELEVVVFVTTSAVIGVLTVLQPAARWSIVALNWASIITFLLLQRIVRRSWGWHAYRLAGISASAVKAFHEYQQFAAVLLLDVFHAIFFVTAEEVVRSDNSVEERVATYTSAGVSILLARFTQMVVRYEYKRAVWCSFCLYVVGMGVYTYFAIVATQRAVRGQGHVMDDGSNISSSGERVLVAAVEWCVVVVRCALLSAVARVCSSFSGTLPSMFPRRALKPLYLIDQAAVDAARNRAASIATSVSPRQVTMYDASARATSVLGTGIRRNGSNLPQHSVVTIGQTQPYQQQHPIGSTTLASGLEDFEESTGLMESTRSIDP